MPDPFRAASDYGPEIRVGARVLDSSSGRLGWVLEILDRCHWGCGPSAPYWRPCAAYVLFDGRRPLGGRYGPVEWPASYVPPEHCTLVPRWWRGEGLAAGLEVDGARPMAHEATVREWNGAWYLLAEGETAPDGLEYARREDVPVAWTCPSRGLSRSWPLAWTRPGRGCGCGRRWKMREYGALFLFAGLGGGYRAAGPPPKEPASHLDPSRVALVNDICLETGARIVVSSAWRTGVMVTWLREVLRKAGLTAGVHGATPVRRFQRGYEIAAWLAAHRLAVPSTCIAILDDDDDMAELTPRLVQTSFDAGIQPEHCARAAEMLRTPLGELADVACEMARKAQYV